MSTASCGSPLLWQNLFWFFGHPEVYILALPFFGIVTEVLPVFSRKPVFGYKGMVFATMAIAALSTGVWAHHMFTTGAVLLPFFSFLSLLIAVPTGIKFFNWIGTMWHGQLIVHHGQCCSRIGFLFAFLMGGVTGIMLASPPIDFATHDTYFVVAHFHQVLFGTAVFAGFAGLYYWYPKMFGRMLREDLGKWPLLAHVHRLLGDLHAPVRGRPAGHAPTSGQLPVQPGLAELQRRLDRRRLHHRLSFFFLLVNFVVSWRNPVPAGNNPWDAHTLEWFTTSPPPHHNYTHLPPIRSERPTWDYNHPDDLTVPHGKAAHLTRRRRRHEDRGHVPALPGRLLRHRRSRLLVLELRGRRHVMLAGTCALGFLPGSYYFFWHRRMGQGRVEDRERRLHGGGCTGVIDSFPGSSIWPFVLGMGAFLTVLALVFGVWLIFFGVPLILTALVGVTAESRRGGHV